MYEVFWPAEYYIIRGCGAGVQILMSSHCMLMPAALGIHHVFRSSLALSPSFLLSFLMLSFFVKCYYVG